jgi:protease-4
VDDGDWLVVDLHGALPEYDPPADPMSKLLGGSPLTLTRALDSLEKAAHDERIAGVLLKIAPNGAGWASVEELRGAVADARKAGKPVYAWSDNYDLKGLFLASACDSIFVMPLSDLTLTGIRSQSLHVKRALDKLGIKPDLHRIKDYKAAAELLTREDLSEAAKENDRWIMDEFWRLAADTFQRERGVSEETMHGLMEDAVFLPQRVVEAGLIDELIYFDELEARLAARAGDEDDLPTVAESAYAKVERKKLDLEGDKTIAVVHAQGNIGGRKNRVDPMLGVMMGHESVVAQLKAAREDEDVAAIIFRVDSGGGSVLTSNQIAHEVANCAAAKPTVCSMVDVAASGGYDIAYHASKLVADAFTVTGSIGSISGKFNVKAFHEKLGITHDHVDLGPNAGFWSDQMDFTPEQREKFVANHWAGYNAWVDSIAAARGMTHDEVAALGGGRVWTGTQALENGLIDAVGGLDAAIALAKEMAEIPADEQVTIRHIPKTPGLLAMLTGGGDKAAAVNWLLYRWLHEDLAATWRLVADGAFADQVVAPR